MTAHFFLWMIILIFSTISIYVIAKELSKPKKPSKEFQKFQEQCRMERAKNAKKNKTTVIPKNNITVEKNTTIKPPPVNFAQKLMEELALKELKSKTKPKEWTLEVLMSLEWKRFEEICQKYLVVTGQHARLTKNGADGGFDIEIWNDNNTLSVVQCKAWIWKITVKEIRELYGVMASEKASEGIFITTSSFTQDAIAFSQGKNITLIDGQSLISKIKSLDTQQQKYLLNAAIAGDYTTPTCPNCDLKMVKRTGNNSGKDFWGCMNYPRCKNTLQVRST